MSNHSRSPRLSRRDTLKACLLPAGVITARWLVGCSDGTQGNSGRLGTGGDSPLGSGGASPNTGSTDGAGGAPPASMGTGGQASPSTGGSSPITGGTGGKGNMPPGAGGSVQPGAGGATEPGAGGGMQPAAGGSGGATATGGTAGAGGGTSNVPWATGGTKSIMGGYPDPFGSSPGTACAIYPSQTLGPCYSASPMMRSDISDAMNGLPMRMSLLVVRASGCAPVPDATVDIWHSGSNGIYSAFATGTICNPGTENVLAKTFCRGVQATNADGRVDFDTVFPGWYTGRTIHIHFTIRIGTRAYVTSQLYFEDALSDEILAQGLYAARGKRDTTNASDGTFRSGGAMPAQVLFSWAKRADGVLHAWKVLSIG